MIPPIARSDLTTLRIEPALLSVVCRELNARRREQGLPRITGGLLAGTHRGILADFYQRGVAGLPPGARRFVEDRLLTRSGYRDSVALENATAGDGSGLTGEQLDRLVSRRLLRVEERLGSRRVELTHDVLAAPIKASRDARREHEALAAAEERARRAAVEARRRRHVLIGVVVVALAVIGALAAFSRLLVRQRDESRTLRLQAEQSARDGQEKLWNALVSQARAGRYSGLPGQRIDGLKAIADAARIRLAPVLRDEAIACMALPDVTELTTIKGNALHEQMCFDDTLHRYARSDALGNIRIYRRDDWSPAGGKKELMTLPGLGAPVGWAFAFSPGGRYLCASYTGGFSRFLVWDLETREAIFRLGAGLPSDDAVDFNRDGTAIALGLPGGAAVFELSSGKRVAAVNVPGTVERVRIDPAGQRLATYTRTAGVQVRSARSGALELTIRPPDHLSDLCWNHDGTALAGACDDMRLYTWDARTGRRWATMQGSEYVVIRAQFLHGDELLASGAWDGTVRLWDPGTGKLFLTTHGFDTFLQVSTDESLIAFSGSGTMHVCRLSVSRECRSFGGVPGEDQSFAADFSPDGTLVAAANNQGVHLWDAATGRSMARLTSNQVRSVFFSPDGRWLFASGKDGLRRWAVPAHAPTLPATASESDRLAFPQPAQLAPASDAAALSADGHNLVFDSGGGNVCLMDQRAPDKVTLLGQHPGTIRFVAVSSDGRWGATSARNSNVFKVWNLIKPGPPIDLLAGGDLVDSGNLSFSPDGRRLATADPTGVRFWDVGTWKLHHQCSEPGGVLLAFAPDGRTLATTGPNFSTIVLDAETGRTLATLMAPQPNAPGWVTFNPDGSQLLLLGGGRGVLTFWHLKLLRSELAPLNLDWR